MAICLAVGVPAVDFLHCSSLSRWLLHRKEPCIKFGVSDCARFQVDKLWLNLVLRRHVDTISLLFLTFMQGLATVCIQLRPRSFETTTIETTFI